MATIIDQRAIALGRPSWRFLICLFLSLTLAQMLMYHESFRIKPTNDDFGGLITDIYRGEMEGPGSFFMASTQAKNYRPLSSMIAWVAGRWTLPEPWLAIHITAFVCMGTLGLCVFAWTRLLPLTRAGVIVVGLLTYFHPAVAPQLASVDGLGGLVATLFMWLGAYATFVYRDRPGLAAVTTGVCLILGGLTKEYALGLAPLSLLTAVVLPSRHKFRLTVTLACAIFAIGVALLLVRHFTQLQGVTAKVPAPAMDPKQIATNLALFAAVTTYFGHVAWVYLNRDVPNLLLFAVSVGVTVLIIGAGLLKGLSRRPDQVLAMPPESPALENASEPSVTAFRWTVFLLLSFLPACFPANILPHVSEMYAGSLVVPLALLAGLATEGVCGMAKAARVAVAMLSAGQLALAGVCITQKVSELRHVGDRTDIMLRQLDALIPANAHDAAYLVAFLEKDIASAPVYSIYMFPDDRLLLPDLNNPWNGSIIWMRPGRRLHLDTIVFPSIEQIDPAPYADVFVWDASLAMLTPLPKERH